MQQQIGALARAVEDLKEVRCLLPLHRAPVLPQLLAAR
jgi:hypothetical protein